MPRIPSDEGFRDPRARPWAPFWMLWLVGLYFAGMGVLRLTEVLSPADFILVPRTEFRAWSHILLGVVLVVIGIRHSPLGRPG
jgi:hypothetical protein